MNNKEIAIKTIEEFGELVFGYDNLIKLLTNALDKEAGEPEHDFKFGDRVVTDSEEEGIVINNKEDKYRIAKQDGSVFWEYSKQLSLNPAYANTLQFIEHNGSVVYNAKPTNEVICFYSFGALIKTTANMIKWNDVTYYAIVPEDFLK